MYGFRGSIVTQPMEYEPILPDSPPSKTGANAMPPFSVLQTPPAAVATNQRFLSVGSTATSTTRPEVTAGPMPRRARPAQVSASQPPFFGLSASAFSSLDSGPPAFPLSGLDSAFTLGALGSLSPSGFGVAAFGSFPPSGGCGTAAPASAKKPATEKATASVASGFGVFMLSLSQGTPPTRSHFVRSPGCLSNA